MSEQSNQLKPIVHAVIAHEGAAPLSLTVDLTESHFGLTDEDLADIAKQFLKGDSDLVFESLDGDYSFDAGSSACFYHAFHHGHYKVTLTPGDWIQQYANAPEPVETPIALPDVTGPHLQTFGAVLFDLRHGAVARRTPWPNGELISVAPKPHGMFLEDSKFTHLAEGGVRDWVPTHEDLLAEDWVTQMVDSECP